MEQSPIFNDNQITEMNKIIQRVRKNRCKEILTSEISIIIKRPKYRISYGFAAHILTIQSSVIPLQ